MTQWEWTRAVKLCLELNLTVKLQIQLIIHRTHCLTIQFYVLICETSGSVWVRSDVHLHVWASLSHCVIRKHVETIRLHKPQVQGDRLPTTAFQTRPKDHESASCCLWPCFLGWGERKCHSAGWQTNRQTSCCQLIYTRIWLHRQICDFWFQSINVLNYTTKFPPYRRRCYPAWSGGCLVSLVCARLC